MKKLLSWVIALFFIVSLAPALTGAESVVGRPAGEALLLAKKKTTKDKKKKKKEKAVSDSNSALV